MDFFGAFCPQDFGEENCSLTNLFFFGGCSLVRPIIWRAYYLEASFHQTCPYQFFQQLTVTAVHCRWSGAMPSLAFVPAVNQRKNCTSYTVVAPAFSLFTTCNLWKKWAVSSAVASLGFSTCNLWKNGQ